MKNKIITIGSILLLISLFFINTNALEIDNKRIWIGDSRTVGLELNVNMSNEDLILAKSGQSYVWFSNTAIKELKKLLNMYPTSQIIINMGVNDCASYLAGANTTNVEEYIKDINSLIEEYPNAKFYYLSINPVNGNYPSKYMPNGYIDKDELNNIIISFNNTIKLKCNAIYINSNDYLLKSGFSTFDGIHYKSNTYQDIYNFVLEKINNNIYKSKKINLKQKNISQSFTYIKYLK